MLLALPLTLMSCDESTQNNTESASEQTTEAPKNNVDIDVEAALKERVMGDVNAPIKITEHSSLTCGHCGKFHETTFKTLKEKYIDTGKAYLVFSDFPLNAPAFHASLSARCIPKDKYFDYIQELFEDQEQWAYEVSYLTYLKKKAADYGLNEAQFNACLGNQDLQKSMLERVRENQTKHGINSTPSFVINDKDKISGAVGLDAFETIFEKTE